MARNLRTNARSCVCVTGSGVWTRDQRPGGRDFSVRGVSADRNGFPSRLCDRARDVRARERSTIHVYIYTHTSLHAWGRIYRWSRHRERTSERARSRMTTELRTVYRCRARSRRPSRDTVATGACRRRWPVPVNANGLSNRRARVLRGERRPGRAV